ncbi:MAG: hypothetical protein K2W82_17700 [Candidatus Obscuribacterales bacterium]|nr:hypothetical protein [Candidatus Obscuribacterales bacterium]
MSNDSSSAKSQFANLFPEVEPRLRACEVVQRAFRYCDAEKRWTATGVRVTGEPKSNDEMVLRALTNMNERSLREILETVRVCISEEHDHEWRSYLHAAQAAVESELNYPSAALASLGCALVELEAAFKDRGQNQHKQTPRYRWLLARQADLYEATQQREQLERVRSLLEELT